MDRLGPLYFPVAPPVLGTDPSTRTPAAGDPLLAILGSFIATAVQADCGDAWEVYEKGFPDLPRTIPGPPGATAAATGRKVVRIVDFVDPRKGKEFDANDFPGLFLYRIGRQTTYEHFTADLDRRMCPVAIDWVAMKDPREVLGEHDTFANAIGASITRAFREGRHPAWVVPTDRAQPQALFTGLGTSTVAITYLGSAATGPLAGISLNPPRPIRITAAAATGAYETTKPIVVTSLLKSGRAFTEKVYLPSANGGHVDTLFEVASLVSVALPPMLSTSGHIDIGYGDSPDARRGSLVQRHARARIRVQRPGELLPLTVQVPDGNPIRGYEAVEVVLQVWEHDVRDPALYVDTNDGADGTTLRTDGEVFATDTY